MAFPVTLYAEGPAEDRGADPFLPPSGQPLTASQCGPAHELVARLVARERSVAQAEIQFLAPAQVKGRFPRGSDLHDPRLLRRLLATTQLRRMHLALVLVDEDGDSGRRRNLIGRTTNLPGHRVIAVAVREFESWLIADQRVLRTVLQVQATPPAAVSMAPREAKQLLHRWIDKHLDSSDQDLRAQQTRQLRMRIAQTIDLATLDRQASFRRFRDDLREALRAMNGSRHPA
ncbi:MAG: hypothetical protein WAT39_21375 [Planctomycetota bacterium]